MRAGKEGGDASDLGHSILLTPQPCWAPSPHRRRCLGLAGRAAWGARTPPILGEEGDGAAPTSTANPALRAWQEPGTGNGRGKRVP